MTTTTPLNSSSRRELAPSFVIPLGLIGSAIPLLWVNRWLSLAIAIFGVFLFVQTILIKLSFTETSLEVYRGNT
ncbi:MAG: hypothetical protein RLZZ490_1591, partial [Cyanobacteriota bacterium]